MLSLDSFRLTSLFIPGRRDRKGSILAVFPSFPSSSNRSDHITLRDSVQGPDVPHRPAEHCIPAVEVGLGTQGDEPLTGSGIGSGQCHTQHRLDVIAHAVDLVAYGTTWTTKSVAAGITILDYEVRHDAVPAVSVEKSPVDEPEKIRDCERRLGTVQLDFEQAALLGLDENMRPGH
jgi:hypothetical protein